MLRLDLDAYQRLPFRATLLVQPILAEKFHWMLRPDGAIPAAQVIRRTIQIASPADAFRVFRMEWDFGHDSILRLAPSHGCDF